MSDRKFIIDTEKISEILARGNTAEIKDTKNGVTILEVARKIRYKEKDGARAEVG
jgi:hypothetical protein